MAVVKIMETWVFSETIKMGSYIYYSSTEESEQLKEFKNRKV